MEVFDQVLRLSQALLSSFIYFMIEKKMSKVYNINTKLLA